MVSSGIDLQGTRWCQNRESWASLVVQWLRICPTMQGTQVRSLVQEDHTCHGATKPVHHNSGGAGGKEPACQRRRQERRSFNPWVGKIPWRRAWPPTPVFLPGESHGQRSLAGHSPWDWKELDTAEQLTYTATAELRLYSPCSARREATIMRSPCTELESSLHYRS